MFVYLSKHLQIVFSTLFSASKNVVKQTLKCLIIHVPETELALCCVVSLLCSCVCHEGI